MSFSSDVKTELTNNIPENQCCRKAFLYGMLIFGRSFSASEISIKSENEGTARLYKALLKELCGVKANMAISAGGTSTVIVAKSEDRAKIIDFFGHSITEISLKINHSNIDCDECADAFFAGAFLSCGTISSPKKDYHLEFVVPYSNLSASLIKLMSGFDMEAKLSNRKGYFIVYFKESEGIEDCLYRMGAHKSAFEIMNVKVFKDFRNKANRVSNCENANINRLVNAVAPQIQAIEKIRRKKGLNFLHDGIREIALLRLDNPEASLQELAQLTSEGLSRSGVNHRLKKIEKIAKEL